MAGREAWSVSDSDRGVLGDLARRLREIAHSPENLERKRLWYKLDAGEPERPMVLIELFGVDDDEFDDDYNRLECTEEWARKVERQLRREIYRFERVGDDKVVEPVFNCPWLVEAGDYGVKADYQHGKNPEGTRGSYRWEAPIKDLDKDFARLRQRTPRVDREARLAWKAHMEEILGDILTVRMRDSHWWTVGLTWEAIKLIGLEGLMLSMYDNPDGLHRLMAFLRDDHSALVRWCESEGLLTLNNENDYIGSGSAGYTRALPGDDWKNGDPVRLADTWVLSESQETVGVSPQGFEEFVFPYQEALVSLFGRCYYGCCEPIHSRWDVVKRFANLKRLSISPWCDQEMMGEALGKDYVFSRKPNPALISTDRFDEEAIRRDLRHTLDAARNCNVEIIMKDVHTVRHHPERFARWVRLARETIAEFT